MGCVILCDGFSIWNLLFSVCQVVFRISQIPVDCTAIVVIFVYEYKQSV